MEYLSHTPFTTYMGDFPCAHCLKVILLKQEFELVMPYLIWRFAILTASSTDMLVFTESVWQYLPSVLVEIITSQLKPKHCFFKIHWHFLMPHLVIYLYGQDTLWRALNIINFLLEFVTNVMSLLGMSWQQSISVGKEKYNFGCCHTIVCCTDLRSLFLELYLTLGGWKASQTSKQKKIEEQNAWLWKATSINLADRCQNKKEFQSVKINENLNVSVVIC